MLEYVGPAIVVLVGNLLSGPPGSRSYEVVTAMFGYASVGILVLWGLGALVGVEGFREYAVPTASFCLLQALSRDYERLLRPLVDVLIGRK